MISFLSIAPILFFYFIYFFIANYFNRPLNKIEIALLLSEFLLIFQVLLFTGMSGDSSSLMGMILITPLNLLLFIIFLFFFFRRTQIILSDIVSLLVICSILLFTIQVIVLLSGFVFSPLQTIIPSIVILFVYNILAIFGLLIWLWESFSNYFRNYF